MLPTEYPFAAATGWALFDWQPSATARATFTRIAGGMSASRLQLDRYRQNLQIVIPNSQIQFWVWAEQTFSLFSWANGTITTFNPHVYPESISVETAITPREARAVGFNRPGIGFGVFFVNGVYYTGRTLTANQITIVNRYFGVYTIAGAIQTAGTRVYISSLNRVRVLAIGHN